MATCCRSKLEYSNVFKQNFTNLNISLQQQETTATIKRVVIETTGVCDATVWSVTWHYIFDVTLGPLRYAWPIGLFFQNAVVEYIGVCPDTNKAMIRIYSWAVSCASKYMVIQKIVLSANTVSTWCHFLWHSNSYIIIMMLCDSHKITKSVTKFWIALKRMDRSHRHQPMSSKCNTIFIIAILNQVFQDSYHNVSIICYNLVQFSAPLSWTITLYYIRQTIWKWIAYNILHAIQAAKVLIQVNYTSCLL